MKRRQLLRNLSLLALASSAGLTAVPEAVAAPQAPLAVKTPALRPGQAARPEPGLKITFLRVDKDARCPINAQCLTPGDATVLVRIKAGNQPARDHEIHTYEKPRRLVIPARSLASGEAGIPKSYVIRIASLDPLPYAGKKTRQKDYRLRLHVGVAQ